MSLFDDVPLSPLDQKARQVYGEHSLTLALHPSRT